MDFPPFVMVYHKRTKSPIHAEPIQEEVQAPTLQSINAIIAVIDAAISHVRSNPNLHTTKEKLDKANKQMVTGLEPPDKVTLKWIWEHTPPSYYWKFILFIFTIFGLGITFANTSLYKSLKDAAIANISTKKTVPPAKE